MILAPPLIGTSCPVIGLIPVWRLKKSWNERRRQSNNRARHIQRVTLGLLLGITWRQKLEHVAVHDIPFQIALESGPVDFNVLYGHRLRTGDDREARRCALVPRVEFPEKRLWQVSPDIKVVRRHGWPFSDSD